YFHHFSNHNFHENVLYQYHHLFYFHVLVGCEIEFLSSREISFSAFERLHNSCIDHSFYVSKMLGIFGFFGRYFHVKYNALYFTMYSVRSATLFRLFAECPISRTKTLRPFFFLREKRNKKT